MMAAEGICPDRRAHHHADDGARDDRQRHAGGTEIEELPGPTRTYGVGMGRQLPPAELDGWSMVSYPASEAG